METCLKQGSKGRRKEENKIRYPRSSECYCTEA